MGIDEGWGSVLSSGDILFIDQLLPEATEGFDQHDENRYCNRQDPSAFQRTSISSSWNQFLSNTEVLITSEAFE